jgi:hypothetical protein
MTYYTFSDQIPNPLWMQNTDLLHIDLFNKHFIANTSVAFILFSPMACRSNVVNSDSLTRSVPFSSQQMLAMRIMKGYSLV